MTDQTPDSKWKAYAVIAASNLTPGARKVATALVWSSNYNTGRCDPGASRVAEMTAMHRQNVFRYLEELESHHIITRTRRGFTSNFYEINWPQLEATFDAMQEQWQGRGSLNVETSVNAETGVLSKLRLGVVSKLRPKQLERNNKKEQSIGAKAPIYDGPEGAKAPIYDGPDNCRLCSNVPFSGGCPLCTYEDEPARKRALMVTEGEKPAEKKLSDLDLEMESREHGTGTVVVMPKVKKAFYEAKEKELTQIYAELCKRA
jgi:hypothetical protein